MEVGVGAVYRHLRIAQL